MNRSRRPTRAATNVLAVVGILASVAVLAACSRAKSAPTAGANQAGGKGAAAELRLGYFPNITHATALIGVERGFFATELGSTKLTTQTFNAGPEAVSALLGNSLDIAFIGSGPAINAFARSNGEAVRLISGATSGGAQLVAKPGIGSAEALRGKKVATPQLGNTQDIALKKWLSEQGIGVGTAPDQVTVINSDNALTLDAFRAGEIDAAWLPEPWASRLVLDAGASVVLDEKEFWPDGDFPTTVIVVRTQYLADHPQTVQALLRGQLATVEWATANKAQAQTVANDVLKKLTGRALAGPVIERAFNNITLTADPLAAQFPQLAKDSVTAGIVKSAPELKGFVDLSALNAVLASTGKPTVDAAGLDRK